MNRRQFFQATAAVSAAGLAGSTTPILQAMTVPAPSLEPADSSAPLWLCWNENPAGLSEAGRRAASQAVARAHRYPDALRGEVSAILSDLHGVTSNQIVLGAGSTQILQAIILSAASPITKLVMASPTFSIMLRYQRPFSYEVLRQPLDDGFAHDLEGMKRAAGQGPAVVYLCNPNNPTGTLTPRSAVDAWIEEAPENILFAIDEAYFEYVRAPGYRSAIDWVEKRRNVVVTRTFSKIYGMAGLRLGYGVAHPETARHLAQFVSSDNVNGLALAAAQACLQDDSLVERARLLNERSKRIVQECLEDLDLAYIPTHTNFIMHEIRGEHASYQSRMLEHGIRVGRPFPPLGSYNRLSLGLPEEMSQWAGVMEMFRQKGWV